MKHLAHILLQISVVLVVTQSARSQTTYYVRTDGNDSNNGLSNTSGGAKLTIQGAVNAAAAGDTVSVGIGTFTKGASLNKSRLVLRGTGNASIVFDTSSASSLGISKDSVTVRDLLVTGSGSSGLLATNVKNLNLTNLSCQSNKGSGVQLTGVNGATVSGGSYSHNTLEGFNTLNCVNVTMTNVTADSNGTPGNGSGIDLVHTTGSSQANNLTVVGNKKHGFVIGDGSTGITITDGTYLQNGTTREYDGGGIFIYADAGSVSNITINGAVNASNNLTAGVWLSAGTSASYSVGNVMIAQTGNATFSGNGGAGVIVYGNNNLITIGGTYTRGTATAAGVIVVSESSMNELPPTNILINGATFNSGYSSSNPVITLNDGLQILKNPIYATSNTFVGATTLPAIETLIHDSLDDNNLGRVYHTNDNPPALPSLLSPADQAAGIATNPALSWGSSAGATNYHLQVSTSPSFATSLIDTAGLSGTSFQLLPLANNTSYYWRVSAYNATGNSGYSPPRKFTTIVSAPSVGPTLLSPAANATNVSLTPSFTWNSVSGAGSYGLQLSADSLFNTIIADANNLPTSYTPLLTLISNTLYYWHVNASNAGGTGPYSPTGRFRTIETPPNPPALSFPADSAVGVPKNATVSWSASAGAVSYDVQVSVVANFATTAVDSQGIAATSATFHGLSNSTTYYWRVSASNSAGTGAFSSARQFTTSASNPPIPPAPTLAFPADSASGISITPFLSWNASSGADSYRLQISSDAGFSTSAIDSQGISIGSCTVSGLAYNTRYYWRVNASNASGTGPYSVVRSFLTVAGALSAPSLIAPADSALSVSTSPVFSWSTVSGASGYRFQLSAGSSFATVLVDSQGIAGTSISLIGLANSTEYFWRAGGMNGAGTGPYSTSRKFRTIIAISPVPVPATPLNGAVDVARDARLTWYSAFGAASYRVQLSTGASFSPVQIDSSGIIDTSAVFAGLGSSTTFYWRVTGVNNGGSSSFSSGWNFTTGIHTGVEDGSEAVPHEFQLRQNFPNPFNPSTRIQFTLPAEGVARLRVYSLLGQLVATLFDGEAGPGRVYQVEFDASRVSSGVYISQLEFGGSRRVIRMILVR